MAYNPNIHHRQSIRLPQFDYAQQGIYFVTICTHQRACILGEVIGGTMLRNEWGDIAHHFWAEVPSHFPNVAVAAFVVMPNHTHANIVIIDHPCRDGEMSGGATQGGATPPLPPTLGQIVAYYKYQTTKAINLLREMPGVRFWQRNYWEHVIRDEYELHDIEEYIQDNPARWMADQFHPAAPPNAFNKD